MRTIPLDQMTSRRRGVSVLRVIKPTGVQATNLYRGAYKPVIDIWAQRQERIVEEYSRALDGLTADAPQDAIEEAKAAVDRIAVLLSVSVRDWAAIIEEWQRSRWAAAVLSASGVDLSTMLGAADVRATLATTIEWNTALIRDVSDQIRQRVGNAVYAGLNARRPARDVAREISEAIGMGRSRAQRIASDQLNKLTSALAQERRRQVGINYWEWVHSGKAHPRLEHVARNGRLYADTPAGAGHKIDDRTAAAPPEDLPGQLPYCGCQSRGVIDWATFGDD